jgi:hypothetical protein
MDSSNVTECPTNDLKPESVLTPIRKPRRITVKQKLFAQEYVKSKGNGQQSALKVYDTKDDHVARSIATENLTKPVVADEIRKGFEKAGLTINKAFELHTEGMLRAVKEGQPRMSDGFKALDMFYKINNMYPNNIKKVQHESIKYVFDGKDDKELQELIRNRLVQANKLSDKLD